ncbi:MULTISPECIES: winged helix-turn-helix domain-containing protein [Archaeoglobus]|jgi:molybdate transport system regulatory protein|uniref:Molybdenum-pterin-binding protein (MopB) n=3 Tax=Archaeoglobus fulgidus TaxID=2234 RepID=O29240_ARCFU|nr:MULTISPECIES: winged helix-turn-helix domain-containing protein [Archaeoglobus]AAB90221.1 molybdenum-pterin-binding protein (mopB) [Archaeoglobus fulgidus DSM 4304]AIG97901.1 ModE molybdate transport repressor domain protein [Archaeoglobus fulgidus DSM 8774]KUJ92733.1 MAG: Molybdenum-pterin-binding protein (MopB) [Archaeoglobus fulgidus]KUK05815.1 MAG: Molybdenum-pterin-binding protein (MopB) [Archaeoglobus fulgidus]MDI3498446.1 molybdate transport system regulatory protein [Archaeoglobus s
MDIRFRVWIEKGGNHVAGKGGVAILKAIEEEGSISAASKKLGMSYRYVWGYIKKMEEVIGKVVESEKGGSGGGKTVLTEKGREIVRLYEFYESIVKKLASGDFERVEVRDGKVTPEVQDGEYVLIKL